MAVFKRGKTYWYEFSFKGARVRESTHQRNKTIAGNMQAAHRTRLAQGEVGIIERTAAPTLAEFAPRFTEAIKVLCASKPKTITFYHSKLRGLLAYDPLASCPLDAIDEAVVNSYKQHRARQTSRRKRLFSPASVNRELATLRRILRLAQEWKVIDRVPRIRLLRGEQGRDFVLSPEQEKLYLGAASETLRNPAVLMLDTGLRIGEAFSLEWPQVHLEPAAGAALGYVHLPGDRTKNSKPRNVPLTVRAVDMLKALGPAKSGYVFHRGDGQPIYQTWFNQQHSTLRKLLKLPVVFVPHSFRHSYGTRLGESGADAFTIMRLMGHSSVIVSQKYVHPTPEAVERAVQRLEALNQGENRKLEEALPISTTGGKVEKGAKPVSH